MPAVKFTHLGSSPVLGNFSAGDVYRGDEAICRHLVEEARCAEWLEPVAAPSPAEPAPQPAPPDAPAPAAAPRAKKGSAK